MPTICVISLTDSCVCSAKVRTSSATTAKPRPCSPALAASIAAFNAKRLVCSATSPIIFKTLSMVATWLERTFSDSCEPLARLTICSIELKVSFICINPSVARVSTLLASSVMVMESSLVRATPLPSSPMEVVTCSMAAEFCPTEAAISPLPLAISLDILIISVETSIRLCCIVSKAFAIKPNSSFLFSKGCTMSWFSTRKSRLPILPRKEFILAMGFVIVPETTTMAKTKRINPMIIIKSICATTTLISAYISFCWTTAPSIQRS